MLCLLFQYVLENGIQFNGTVKLNGAENEFSIVEDYSDRLNQPTAADEPACIYFGRMVRRRYVS